MRMTAASLGSKLQQRTLDAYLRGKRTSTNTTTTTTAGVSTNAASHVGSSVTLPWSQDNRCVGDAGHVCSAWDIITAVMAKDASQCTQDLRCLMQALHVHESFAHVASTFHFNTLCHVLDNVMVPAERDAFFRVTLPWMKRAVLNGPAVIPHGFPVLAQGESRRWLVTHEEAATLMSCGFFSLFPGRFSVTSTPTRGTVHKLAPFNFIELFCHAPPDRMKSQCAKVRCVLQYFMHSSQNTDEAMATCLEFYRVGLSSFPAFDRSTERMQAVSMHVEGCIEDNYGSLQVDFANKVVGGGVLRSGCVQEEIRFVTFPELLLSRLVSEPLLDNEVLFMSGAGQYSIAEGYARNFCFLRGLSPRFVSLSCSTASQQQQQLQVELMPTTMRSRRDGSPVLLRNCCVVAMDAVNFHGVADRQYSASLVMRETQKAYVAFKGVSNSTLASVHSGPVATGNWGCGAFHGDVELKLMIQWCAASQAGRPLIYSAFRNDNLCCRFALVCEKLQQEEWTVGDVFRALLRFGMSRDTALPQPSFGGTLFDYLLITPILERCAPPHSAGAPGGAGGNTERGTCCSE
ncbi:putative poly(ADP-ribose) glycohydrolase [Trypanosoma grayi]|uniref:putative poly(ADP-ribose) glycohydrolase n=1 Tax=Trypanosoma grayi TaxID=71804 RepID=UPI0004F44502|nr:putative poly(ADP-ribose) glycohydrolase [Trypanosoma grayi]KEG15198.1 putative poly(ADP-ribose) glycohydrolase [Trypanosoma grayi]